jgi:ubiquinone/menaquinone biosynthesis C-methylase UbiE
MAWLVSLGQWSAWRRLALHFMQPGPTLELAYGTGGFFADMLAAGYAPVGLDLSPYMARLASRRLRHNPLRLTQANAQRLPFPASTFTNIVATFPTEYIMHPQTLTEIHRVLKEPPAGRLIIVGEGQLRGPWPLRPLLDWLYEITGQRSIHPNKPLALAAAHHFAAHWELVEYQGAVARLLLAEKDQSSPLENSLPGFGGNLYRKNPPLRVS